VVIHAVIDALLGAAAMGDIGTLFPDTDPQYKDADSKALLLDVRGRIGAKGWQVVNLDVVVQLERPRLEPFKGQIRRSLAGLLDMDFAAVNVKAKTAEGLDAVGQGHAIAAMAIVLLARRPRKPI
jgi:2-C-methyl-D-erythritol 2,4-cyclodiphosphate synthase